MSTIRTLNDRVIEAKSLAPFCAVAKRDAKNRVLTVLTPASEGTQNFVTFRRVSPTQFQASCTKRHSKAANPTCPGNLSGVCRHVLAATFVLMQDAGYTPRFRRSLADAQRLAAKRKSVALCNSAGEPIVFTIRGQGKAELYFIAEDTTASELGRKALIKPEPVVEEPVQSISEPYKIRADEIRVGDHMVDPDGGFISEVIRADRLDTNDTLFVLREAGCGPSDDYPHVIDNTVLVNIRRPGK